MGRDISGFLTMTAWQKGCAEGMETFDGKSFRLGGLCMKKHEFGATGKSLRYIRGASSCVTCAIEYRRTRDAKKRAARLAAAPVYPEGMKKCPACDTLIAESLWRCSPCKRSYDEVYREKNRGKLQALACARAAKLRSENWALSLWRGARSSSKKRNLSFEISVDFVASLWEKQNGRCYWTGVPLLTDSPNNHPLRVSIDRVDSRFGYHDENIVLSTMLVNFGRRNLSPEDTIAALDAITQNYHEKLARSMK